MPRRICLRAANQRLASLPERDVCTFDAVSRLPLLQQGGHTSQVGLVNLIGRAYIARSYVVTVIVVAPRLQTLDARQRPGPDRWVYGHYPKGKRT